MTCAVEFSWAMSTGISSAQQSILMGMNEQWPVVRVLLMKPGIILAAHWLARQVNCSADNCRKGVWLHLNYDLSSQ